MIAGKRGRLVCSRNESVFQQTIFDKVMFALFQQTRIAKGHRRVPEKRREEEHRAFVQESGKASVRGRKLEPDCLAFHASRVFKPIQTFRRADKPVLSRIHDHSQFYHRRFARVFLGDRSSSVIGIFRCCS